MLLFCVLVMRISVSGCLNWGLVSAEHDGDFVAVKIRRWHTFQVRYEKLGQLCCLEVLL